MGRHRYSCPNCKGTFEKLTQASYFRCESPEFNTALQYIGEYRRLIGPSPTGCLKDEANFKRVTETLQLFLGKTFTKKDHLTSFLLGRFDVEFRPIAQQILVTLRLHLDFSNANLSWTSSEQSQFKLEAQQAISLVWDNQATFTLTKAGWPGLAVKPRFILKFVNSANLAHVSAEVFKINQPMSQQGIYDVSKNLLRGFPEEAYGVQKAQLTDLSTKFVKKNPSGYANHNIIAHEFGHMLGLPDEYDDESGGKGWAKHRQLGNVDLIMKTNTQLPLQGYGAKTGDLMSHGTQMHARYYVTVWEALCDLTSEFTDSEEWVLSMP